MGETARPWPAHTHKRKYCSTTKKSTLMSKIKKNRIHFLKSRMKLYEERILAKDLIQKLGKPLRLRGLSLHYSSSQSLETSLASYLSAFSVFCGQLPRKTRAKKSIAG